MTAYAEEVPNEGATTNTYPGYRSDLRSDKDAFDPPTKDELMKIAKSIALQERGVTAHMLAEGSGVSKEWARKILNRMHADGQLTCRRFPALNLFGLPDIPCPHCGKTMSAYIRNGACTRCRGYGGGR